LFFWQDFPGTEAGCPDDHWQPGGSILEAVSTTSESWEEGRLGGVGGGTLITFQEG